MRRVNSSTLRSTILEFDRWMAAELIKRRLADDARIDRRPQVPVWLRVAARSR